MRSGHEVVKPVDESCMDEGKPKTQQCTDGGHNADLGCCFSN
jgi:hypothetical protein